MATFEVLGALAALHSVVDAPALHLGDGTQDGEDHLRNPILGHRLVAEIVHDQVDPGPPAVLEHVEGIASIAERTVQCLGHDRITGLGYVHQAAAGGTLPERDRARHRVVAVDRRVELAQALGDRDGADHPLLLGERGALDLFGARNPDVSKKHGGSPAW